MDHRVENLQCGLHSTLWVLDKTSTLLGVTPTEVYTASHYPVDHRTFANDMLLGIILRSIIKHEN